MRVIPGVTADTHAHVLTGHEGSKFGLAPAAAAELIDADRASPRLRMRGLHVHVGSQILDVEPFAAVGARRGRAGRVPASTTSAAASASATPTPTSRRRSATTSTRSSGAAREHLPADAELIIEPGRSMVASAAATLYRVVTVKRGAGTFVAVDGGMGDNLEVAMYGQRFEAGVVDRLDGADARDRHRGGPALRER